MNMNSFFFPTKNENGKRTFAKFGSEENFLLSSKKIKTEDSTTKSQEPHNNKHIQFNVTDPNKISNLNGFKLLQQLLLLIFSKEMINPGWIAIKNRSAIKKAVICSLDIDENYFEDLIQKKELAFFAEFYNKNSVAICNKLFCEKSFFWESLFSSRRELTSHFEKYNDLTNKLQNINNFEKSLYEKYHFFSLNDDKRESNLYPNKTQKIYSNYKATNSAGNSSENNIIKRIFSLDCEMVKTENGTELARISLIDFDYNTLIDKFVKPKSQILDYHTKYSGITFEILKDVTTNLEEIQEEFLKIINKDSILIGHSLENDLNALQIIHENVIDTSVLFQSHEGFKLSLKTLSEKYLNYKIQEKEHDSVEDAKATLSLAKLRIEILENLNLFAMNKKATYDILHKIIKNDKTIMLLDFYSNLQNIIKDTTENIHFDEFKKNEATLEEALQKLKKWSKKVENVKDSNLIFMKFEKSFFQKDEENNLEILKNFDKEIQQIYQSSSQDTIFIFFTCHEERKSFNKLEKKDEEETQEKNQNLLERNKGFLLFCSK